MKESDTSGASPSGMEPQSIPDAAFYAAVQRCEEADGALMVATGCNNLGSAMGYIKGYIGAMRIANSFAASAKPDDPAAIMQAVLLGLRPVLSMALIERLVSEGESAHREMQKLLEANPGKWVSDHVS